MKGGQCMEGWSVYGGVVSVWRSSQCMEVGQCMESVYSCWQAVSPGVCMWW